MSIFASYTQQTVLIPFDAPETVTIRKLSGRQLEKCRESNQLASVEALKRMGGAALQRELAALSESTKMADLVATATADPLTSYDRLMVLQLGIVAWSYSEAVTPGTIEDLSEEAAMFLAREILALTLPGDRVKG